MALAGTDWSKHLTQECDKQTQGALSSGLWMPTLKTATGISPHIQHYVGLYRLFCFRVAPNLYSRIEIESLFNQFDLVPKECGEVTYAALIEQRKNADMEVDGEMEARYGKEEIVAAAKKIEQEHKDKAASKDGLRHIEAPIVAKRKCNVDAKMIAPTSQEKLTKRRNTCGECGCVGPHAKGSMCKKLKRNQK